jgi:phospholipid/cholesterol/gamma-HCH transport system substrate-binding protein
MTGEKGGCRLRTAAATVLASFLLSVLLVSCSFGGPASNHLTAIFKSTVSLYPRSEVKVLGMRVGTVDAIKVVNDNRVEVSFTVRKGVALPKAVSAVIVPQSLLGARFVQLYPAWVEGQAKLDPSSPDDRVIPAGRTSVPAEPDEALAAVNNLLKSLDPAATGRLVTNLNDDLTGNGQNVNDTVRSLAGLANTLADKDQQLVTLIDNLQQFTTVLDTRESQLGRVMDLFAQTTSLLAQERGTISSLVTGLANVSTNALDLIGRHAGPLQEDIKSLSDLVQNLDGNLNNISILLSSLPTLVAGPNLDSKAGFIAAYNPTYHRIDLRDNLGATVNSLLQALGLPLCLSIPLLGTTPQCAPGSIVLPLGLSGPAPAAPTSPTGGKALGGAAGGMPASPLASVLNLLGNGGSATPQVAAYGRVAPPPVVARRGALAAVARFAHGALGRLW